MADNTENVKIGQKTFNSFDKMKSQSKNIEEDKIEEKKHEDEDFPLIFDEKIEDPLKIRELLLLEMKNRRDAQL